MDVHFVKRFPSLEEGRKGKSVYIERAPGQTWMKIYVTLEDPSKFSSTLSPGDIGELIAQSITKTSGSYFVDNIAERDAIVANVETRPTSNCFFVVKDATTDPELSGPGGMMYYYRFTDSSFSAMYRINQDPYHIVSWNELGEKPPFGEIIGMSNERILTYDGKPVSGSVITDPSW